MRWKRLDEWDSGTVKRILNRHPYGFIGYNITGERGTGKSTYAYKVMAKIYQLTMELNEYDAYFEALNYMIFSPKDLIRLVQYNMKHNVISPVICLDDATVHFNSYQFFIDIYEVTLLKGMFDTIRTAVTGLLMTCPNRKQLLKFLRDYDDYKIVIKRAPGGNGGISSWSRYARCYQFLYYPDEQKKKVLVPFQDLYSTYVPGKIDDPTSPFGAYMEKRNHYLAEISDKMAERMQIREKRKKYVQMENVLKEERIAKKYDEFTKNQAVENLLDGKGVDKTLLPKELLSHKDYL